MADNSNGVLYFCDELNGFALKTYQAKYISQTEAYSRIALKSQEQARKTLLTLAEIKSPKKTAFIKQLQMN